MSIGRGDALDGELACGSQTTGQFNFGPESRPQQRLNLSAVMLVEPITDW